MSKPMTIHTIIVNYRTPESTVRAIEAAAAGLEGTADWQITVVDNGSGDDSVEVIGGGIKEFPFAERVTLVESKHNGGFGYGNN
ncbi:MAG: hypothetical protein MI757_02005, partial [Pirellulales bacterium]|nr:hypothetical protein [Pirellulales bacterium]